MFEEKLLKCVDCGKQVKKVVLEESDNQTDRQTRVNEIIQGVNNRLSQLDSLEKPVHRRLPRQ